MGINIRAKGQNGEREIADMLNLIVATVLEEYGYSATEKDNHNFYAQRNQQQTAVGGFDLVNTYGFGIEVKRQEALSISAWWKQCTDACKNGEMPVLVYRQSRKPWKVVTKTFLKMGDGSLGVCRSEISIEAFLAVYESHVRQQLKRYL